MAIVNNLNLRKELQNLSFECLLEGNISSDTVLQCQYRSVTEEAVLFFKLPRFKFPEVLHDLYQQEISAASQDLPIPVLFFLFSGGLLDKYTGQVRPA